MKPTSLANNTVDKNRLGVFRYSRRAISLVWQTSPALTIGLAIATFIAGVLSRFRGSIISEVLLFQRFYY
ncbi:hypothetical protein [Marinomonas algicola]|uniref:hypothetical protein n=1 Tax=Marinomonas algicola TaxID=2773454 RepID=UPI0017485F58|nr:hypothetical protein [Marinomonas algicola]